jgi:mono/diheme cytochrome c family protein
MMAGIHGLAAVLIMLSAVYCSSFAIQSAAVATQASLEQGTAIFRKSCSVCHSVRRGETKVGPSLYGILKDGSGHSEQSVRQAIAAGKGTMPAFKEKLESQQMNDLIEYLRTR